MVRRSSFVLSGLCLSLSLLVVEARAEPAETARTRRAMHTYYADEKAGAFDFAVPGLASIAVGSALLAADTGEAAKGAAVPILAFGAIEVGAGLVLYLRNDALVARRDAQLSRDPRAFRDEETTYLRRVVDQFAALAWIELAIASAGVGMTAVGSFAKTPVAQGVGIGLALEATKLFVLDAIADRRTGPYLAALASFRLARATDGFTLGYGARF